jgi:hypothetical protein
VKDRSLPPTGPCHERHDIRKGLKRYTRGTFAYRRIHLHHQFGQQTQITMNNLNLSLLNLTKLALLVLTGRGVDRYPVRAGS